MAVEDHSRAKPSATGRPNRALGWGIAAFAAAVTLALSCILLASSFALTDTAAREDIETRLAELTGQEVFVDGPVSFDLFPRPVLVMTGIRIGAGDGPVLSIERLQADLDLTDALVGRTDIGRMILTRAELDFPEELATPQGSVTAASLAGPSGAADTFEAPLAYLQSFFERFEGVRLIELREGVFRPRNGSLGFSNANLQMRWPERDAPAEVTGSFVWNGQPTELQVRIEKPKAFLVGEPSALRMGLSSPPLQVRFEGEGSGGPERVLDGTFRLATPSIPRSAQWLGASAAAFPEIGAASLDAQVHVEEDRMTLASVRVAVGEQTGQGALEAVFPPTGRAAVTGTLAFPELDLGRFTRAIAPLPRHVLDFHRPMAIAFMQEFDLDLRISASEAGIGDLPFRQFAATVIFADGRATLDIGDTEILGGRAQGRLSIDLRDARPLATGRLDLASVEASGLARFVGLQPMGLEGRANLSAEFSAPASNWNDVLRENAATVSIAISDGNFTGLTPASFATPGERSLSIRPNGPPVAFKLVEAELATRGPYLNLRRLVVDGADGRAEAMGFIAFLGDHLHVEGTFAPRLENAIPSQALAASLQPIPFRMQGQWPEPVLTVGASAGPM